MGERKIKRGQKARPCFARLVAWLGPGGACRIRCGWSCVVADACGSCFLDFLVRKGLVFRLGGVSVRTWGRGSPCDVVFVMLFCLSRMVHSNVCIF